MTRTIDTPLEDIGRAMLAHAASLEHCSQVLIARYDTDDTVRPWSTRLVKKARTLLGLQAALETLLSDVDREEKLRVLDDQRRQNHPEEYVS